MIIFKDYPQFTPDFTPEEMFIQGIVGGSYFRIITSLKTGKTYFPQDSLVFPFLTKIPSKLISSEKYDKLNNKFKKKAGSSYDFWTLKNWINEENASRGWIQWYCYFYMGRRSSDDLRQIKRWENFASEKKGRFRIRFQNIIDKKKINNITISPVIQQNLLEWAVDSTLLIPQ